MTISADGSRWYRDIQIAGYSGGSGSESIRVLRIYLPQLKFALMMGKSLKYLGFSRT